MLADEQMVPDVEMTCKPEFDDHILPAEEALEGNNILLYQHIQLLDLAISLILCSFHSSGRIMFNYLVELLL